MYALRPSRAFSFHFARRICGTWVGLCLSAALTHPFSPQVAVAAPSSTALAVVTQATGNVVMHQGGKAINAKAGTTLRAGDRIETRGGSATIFFLNGPQRKLSGNSSLVIAKAPNARNGSLIRSTYVGLSQGLASSSGRVAATMRTGALTIVSPIDTAVLDPKTLLRWTLKGLDKAAITSYEIEILDREKIIAHHRTTQTELPLSTLKIPTDTPLRWRVTPYGRVALSGQQTIAQPIVLWRSREVGFSLASTTTAQRTQAALAEISRNTASTAAQRQLARAALLSGRGFFDAALAELASPLSPEAKALRLSLLPPSENPNNEVQDAALQRDVYAKEVVTPRSLKTYNDPYGTFSIKIPITWGYNISDQGQGMRQTEWRLRPISSPQLSVVTAPAAPSGAAATLNRLWAKARQAKVNLTGSPLQRVQWNGRTVQRQDWKARYGLLVLNGTAWTWSEKGRDVIALTSWLPGDEKYGAMLAPCLASLRINAVPDRKTPTPNPWDKVTAEQILNEMRVTTQAQGTLDMLSAELALRQRDIKPSVEAFRRLDTEYKATKLNTLERAIAASRAAACAAELAWQAFAANQAATARQWFSCRTTLQNEAFIASVGACRARMATNRARIDQIRNATPPIQIADNLGALLDIRLALQQGYAVQGHTLAYNQSNTQELEKFARIGWDIVCERIDLMALNGTYSVPTPAMRDYTRQLVDFQQYRHLNRRIDAADFLINLCEAALVRADWQHAEAFAQRSLAWQKALPDSAPKKDESAALRKLALIADNSGDYVVARNRYEQLWRSLQSESSAREKKISSYTEPSHRLLFRIGWMQDRALALNNLGLVLVNLSDFDGARAKYQQALAIIETEGAKMEADAQSTTAPSTPQKTNDGAQGAPEVPIVALPEFIGAEGLKRAYIFRDQLKATVLGNLATLEDSEGNLDKTTDLIDQSYALLRNIGQDREAALMLFNGSTIYYEKDDLDSSASKMRMARDIFVQLQDTRYLTASTYTLARLERLRNHYPEAETLAAMGLQLAEARGNSDDIANASCALATIRLERWLALPIAQRKTQVLSSVEGPLRQASTQATRSGRIATMRGILVSRSMLQEARGDLKGALESLLAAIARIEAVRANSSDSSNYAELADIADTYERTVRLQLRLGLTTEAFDTLSRSRSKRLFDSLRVANLKSPDPKIQGLLDKAAQLESKKGQLRSQLEEENSKPDETRDGEKIANLKNQLAATQAEFFAMSAQIKAQHPGFEKALAVNPLSLKKAQPAIPQGTLLLQYVPLGQQVYIFAVTRSSLKIFTAPVSPQALAIQVRELRDVLKASEKRVEQEIPVTLETDTAFLGASQKLYDSLVTPVASEWKKAKHVALIPNGELYYLPFHALVHRTTSGLKFWAEETTLSYLMGADVLSIVQQRSTTLKGSVLALGDPTGANLPAAREEATAVARLFPASEALVGDQATKEALIDASHLQKRALHLATHGVLNPVRPDRSFIQLAPDAHTHDDGKLRVSEIYGLDLKGVDLVTLSACQTALGSTPPNGTEITSLAESFSSAGTPSVVASLWNVEDSSTRELMEHFYRGLADGKSKAEALRAAQTVLIKNPKTRHPFFWAPFELLGDWR